MAEALPGNPEFRIHTCTRRSVDSIEVSFKEDQPNRVQSHHGISLEIEVLSSPYNEEAGHVVRKGRKL